MEEKNNNNFESVPVEDGELSNEELEGVTGGFGICKRTVVNRYFVCGDCKHVLDPNKPLHTCDNCGSHNIVSKRTESIVF